jgi:membrane fusion protein (multidrug efflux system)
MHDVARKIPATRKMKKGTVTSVFIGAFIALCIIIGTAGLLLIRVPNIKIVITVASVGVVLYALAAIWRFRAGSSTAGAVFGIVSLLCVMIDVKSLQVNTMMSSPKVMPPTTVSSAGVKEEDWPPTLSAIGSVSAVQGAVVATELGGVVSEVNFQNGGVAKKGDVLLKLDASSEEGQLHTAEADLELARANLQRTKNLAARKVVSKQELDAGQSAFGQKQGVVDNMRSMITKKQVHAPFDGMLGIRQVNVGQTINAGQQVVQLTALDPVYVDFALPQQHLPRLGTGFEARVHSDSLAGRAFNGKITAINSMVDAVTRNVGLQATLDNPDHALRPGMFVKVDVVLPEKSKTLVVPGSAISYAPYGDSVFVIEKKKDPKTGKESQAIRQQFVRVGEARGDFVAITQGLKAGETVVSTGVFKLRNGMPVVVNNDLGPKPQLNPTPADS